MIDESSKRLNSIKGSNLGTLKNEKLKLIDFNKNTKQDLEIIRKYLLKICIEAKKLFLKGENVLKS